MASRLLFIRHGATALNNDDVSVDRIRGWRDVPLSPEGRAQADLVAARLAKDPPDVLVTSDLKRAHDTAKVIAQRTGVPIVAASRAFRPWDVGELAGETTARALPILDRYATQAPDEPVPGGESFNSFKQRFFDGLHTMLEKLRRLEVALVAHHRNERLLAAWTAAGAMMDGTIDLAVFHQRGDPTGSLVIFNIPLRRMAAAAEPEHGLINR